MCDAGKQAHLTPRHSITSSMIEGRGRPAGRPTAASITVSASTRGCFAAGAWLLPALGRPAFFLGGSQCISLQQSFALQTSLPRGQTSPLTPEISCFDFDHCELHSARHTQHGPRSPIDRGGWEGNTEDYETKETSENFLRLGRIIGNQLVGRYAAGT